MVAPTNTAIEKVLGGLAGSLTVDVAQRIVHLRLDSESQAALNRLASKASAGTLSEHERMEYLELVEAVDILAAFQARAHDVLAGQIK